MAESEENKSITLKEGVAAIRDWILGKLNGYLPLSGGTVSGDLKLSDSHAETKQDKVIVMDSDGALKNRTLSELQSDFGVNIKAGTGIGSVIIGKPKTRTISVLPDIRSGATIDDMTEETVDMVRAIGQNSVAEGDAYGRNEMQATGICSHAEGGGTYASGDYSHAEGICTLAESEAQHAFGKYNVGDENGTYAEIVGNGTSYSTRSNARTLDWSGNEKLAGKLTVGADPTDDMDAATKKYVDDLVAESTGSGSVMTDADITEIQGYLQ